MDIPGWARERLPLALGAATFEAVIVGGALLVAGIGDPLSGAIGAFLGIFLLTLVPPFARPLNDSWQTWRSMWHLGRHARREVYRAVRHGRAVTEPTLAPQAVRVTTDAQRLHADLHSWRWRWLYLLYLMLSIVSIAEGHVIGVILLLVIAAIWLLGERLAPGRARRNSAAEAANRNLLKHR